MSVAKVLVPSALAALSAISSAQYGVAKPEFPGAAKLRLQGEMYRSLVLADSSVIQYLDQIVPGAMLMYQGRQTSQWTSESLALRFAEAKYQDRGGYYHLGPNDCSTFVCDFLGQMTTTIPHRFTTDRLFNPVFMNNSGFVQVTDVTRDLEEYDVIVYRYFDADFQAEGGHCGIVVWRDGQLCIEHNSSSNKGLACTPIEEFYRSVARRRDLRGPHVFRLSAGSGQ